MDMHLRKGIIVPAVVVTEYVKIAGSRVGSESALAHISELEARAASIAPINRDISVLAGNLLLRHPTVPIADALIGATAKLMHAEQVLTDDPHFKKLGIKTRWF